MDGASDGWTRAWPVPFLLRSMRGGYLSPKQALERCRREIELFFLYVEQPVHGVRR
jgi:hypothetical protein